MNGASIPANEAERLAALHRYGVLDTPSETAFDDLTRLAAQICATPISIIGLLDKNRIWFKSKVGVDPSEVSRDHSFCAYTILARDPFIVENAAADPRFANHPLVKSAKPIGFYAGLPLITPDGFALGTFCVMDYGVRRLSGDQMEALRILSHQAITRLELTRNLSELSETIKEQQQTEHALKNSEAFYLSLVEGIPQNIFRKDHQGRFTFANRRFCNTCGRKIEEIIGKTDYDFFPAELARKYQEDDHRLMQSRKTLDIIEENQTASGGKTFVHVVKTPILDFNNDVIGIQGIFWDVTERIKTEQALDSERELLNTLMMNSPDRIYFKDEKSRFVKCSMAVCAGLGISDPAQAVGKTDYDFFTEEHAKAASEDERRIIETGKPVIGLVEKEVWLDGKVTFVLTTKLPMINKAGQIVGTFGISKDITALKETERDLEYERQLLTALLCNVPDCIYFKDAQSRFIKASNELASRFGLDNGAALVGKTDFDFFSEEHARQAYDDEQAIIRTGQPVIGKLEKETYADGHITWALTSKLPLCNKNGQTIGTFGISKDITDLKKTEAALAYERDLLRALLDNSPDRISFKDVDGRYLKCSKTLAKRIGLAHSDQVVGKTDFDFYSKETADEILHEEKEIVATGKPLVSKIEKQVDRDGNEGWMSVSKVPIYNQTGTITGIIGLSRDITSLKRAEAELQLARDAALESARLKSEFLANMSHEIRTPMNAIIGMTGLLLETEMNEEQRDFAETTHSSADALLSIINDILDFSKIEAGRLTFETIDFDLLEVVEGTVELVAARAQSKGIELVSWVHHEVPLLLRGDPGRLRQVVANLLSNAVKFTHQGEVVVRVVKVSETESRAVLRFTVSDTGIGISGQAVPLLFQPFTQADGSMTRKYGGTGLGLAISKQLVELMNGQIGCDSTLGKGSTFWFTVNLQKQPAKGLTGPREKEKGSLVGLRVLIVDDNATNRQIVHHQIISWRMRNGHAASGSEALSILRCEAAAGDPYDLVILDQQMPEMDGLALARKIKADPTVAGARLVMLTSLGLRLDPNELREAGIATCLVKPVKQSRLFDCLATVMSDVDAATPTATKPAPAKPAPTLGPLPEEHRNIHILLAEDNPVNQKVALRQLHKLGFKADAVGNGLEVLDSLKRIPYDIILMDCQMPEMDGYEATRRIRDRENAIPHSPDLPARYIIALTANALQGDREKCLKAGMNDYISKPVQLNDIQAALVRAIEVIRPKRPGFPESPPSTASVLDPAAMAGLRELQMPGEPDPVVELIDLFMQDAPQRWQLLEEALLQRNLQALESASHSLKGSAGNLGARHLATLFAEIEKLARSGTTVESAYPLAQAKDEFQKALKALEIEKGISLANANSASQKKT